MKNIYQNDPNDTLKLLEFSSNLKSVSHQIKLIHSLLNEAAPNKNVRHLSMIIQKQKMLKKAINDSDEENYNAVSVIENDFPEYLKPYWGLSNLHFMN